MLGRVRDALAVAAVLTAANYVLWAFAGESTLERALPGMARHGLKELRGKVPYDIPVRDIRVEPYLDSRKAELLSGFREVFAEYGFAVHTEKSTCPRVGPFGVFGDFYGCLLFRYDIEKYCPFVAEVSMAHFLWSGGASGFTYRRLWLFGFWVPITDEYTWIE